MSSFMPHFTSYWGKSEKWIENEIAVELNLPPQRIAQLSLAEKQRRTIKLRQLRFELESRAKWAEKAQAKIVPEPAKRRSVQSGPRVFAG